LQGYRWRGIGTRSDCACEVAFCNAHSSIDLMADEKKEGWIGRWYGQPWLEFILALVAAHILQSSLLPDLGMVILLPLTWLAIYFTIGGGGFDWLGKLSAIELWK
jgi:hypothetical protein